MKKLRLYILVALLLMAGGVMQGQVRFDWQWGYGSMGDDYPYCVTKIADGYLVGGSIDNDGGFSVECEHSSQRNGWIIKLNEVGELVDQSCVEMGNISQISQSKTNPNHYYLIGEDPVGDQANTCIVKVDEQFNVLWKRVIGNPAYTSWYAPRVVATSDGGCIGGHSVAWDGGDISHHFDLWDAWIFKFDSDGNMQWEVTLGTESNELVSCIKEMNDGSFTVLINGSPQQFGSLYSCNQRPDIFFGVVAKLDADGNILDNRCYGGYNENDCFNNFIELEDGYLYVGGAVSDDGDLEGAGHHFGYHQGLPQNGYSGDAWLMKTDFDGNVIWSKCYGGSLEDVGCKVFQNDDGGFTVTGWSESRDGDVQSALQLYEEPEGSWGPQKPWIFRTDAQGILLWERVMGADVASVQYYNDALQVSDKEYVFLCQETLYPSTYPCGDIYCPNVVSGSQENYWVFHLTDIFDYEGVEEQEGWNGDGVGVYPNPSKDLVKIYGIEPAEVQVYNALGQMVKTVRGINEIDMSGLVDGVYFVRIRDKVGRSFMEKVLVK